MQEAVVAWLVVVDTAGGAVLVARRHECMDERKRRSRIPGWLFYKEMELVKIHPQGLSMRLSQNLPRDKDSNAVAGRQAR